jgi:saccharopine dehydrogenase (NADP+, L-glutamate forming)
MRDMVVLLHELDVEYPDSDRPPERVRSTLVVEGEAGGDTAMTRSVGLPILIAVKLLLRGELSLTGSLIPTHPAIYTPILERIEQAGLRFNESRKQIADS